MRFKWRQTCGHYGHRVETGAGSLNEFTGQIQTGGQEEERELEKAEVCTDPGPAAWAPIMAM